jgi:regulation of enolase protein 1 (concanavalin A-like superfamily)
MVTKKWLFVGIFTLLSLSLALAAPPAVHPTTGAPLVITCLRGTPDAIDGDLSDWNLDAMTPAVLDAAAQIYTGGTSWTGVADCSGKFYVQWDDKNVYFGVVVKDDKLSMTKSGVDIWNADCAEVFFSTLNAVAGHAEHYQWGFNANNQKWCWESMDGNGAVDPANLKVVSTKTADGYVCEAALDYTGIRALKIAAGNTIGFHVGIDDTDATDREVQMTWTGREAHDQSLGFGNLIFSSDAAIAKGLSRGPSPAPEAVDVPLDAILSWSPGKFAASHDVYFGTSLADVNTASRTNPKGVLASQGQTAATFDPPGVFAYGQTYYWRVDEVNAAPDNTIYQGPVWSFTTEPYGYPIKPVAVTASSAQPSMGPDKTIDGSGLDKSDLHGTEGTTMWLSAGAQPNWIQYQFDKVYKLYDLKVWNSNGLVESFIGFGAKKVTIEYSADGTTWTVLANVPEFARAPGMPGYAANTTVSLGRVMAKYVKLTINSTWGGISGVTGLAEVRFSAVPVQAFTPQPATAATGVSMDSTLNWRPGREAKSHTVFFGTDQAAVAGGTAAAKTVADPGYTPGSLNFGTTYYWKVDEVNAVTYPGDVWSFTTQEYAAVDSFESYNDDDNRIYDAWIDGYTDGSSGSIVGYMTAPFAEQTIIHGGKQALPFEYNNVKTPFYSEASRTFDTTQNWTANGADTVSLYFQGRAAGFLDNGNNTFTVSSSGTDIWNAADQFRFVYKSLSGNGSIMVKVDSLVNTNVWAKAGVMIRQSLDTGSAVAYMIQSAASGASFGWRPLAAGTPASIDKAGIVAPQWVKLTRTGNAFTAQYSADGKTWTDIKNADGTVTSTAITMTGSIYIGLCVTSHDAALTTTAQFSNVSTTGTVTGSWQALAIGAAMPSNGPAPLYLTVTDKAGKTKTVVNPNPSASATAAWTEWRIPLSNLTGVSLTTVQKITLGVGDRVSPKAGAAGMLYFDDIGYGHPVK